LKSPLIKADGRFREATWEEALSLIADSFGRIKETCGADALAVFGSARDTNEENYLLQRFTRGILGTNNIDNGSRLYSAASRVGLGTTLGYAGTTGSLDTLERSQVIIVIGADPEISAPIVAYAIKRAARSRGARVIVIDPRPTALAQFTHLWLPLKPGTDIALLNGLARVIVNEKKLDEEFVTRMTDNFAGWEKGLTGYTPARVEELTGVPRKDIQAAARLLAGAEEASIVYGNGITQQPDGTGAVIAIANLAMLTGNVGRRGGIFALQRESNAHGACDMGTLPDCLPGYLDIGKSNNRQKFEERWRCALPARAGKTVLEMVEGAGTGAVKGMFIMGENPVLTIPQPSRTREALSKLDFLVVSDMFLTETAALASVVLPAASFAEKDGTVTNFAGVNQRMQKALKPAGNSLPEGEIILRLAAAFGSPMPYSSLRQIQEEIEEMVPFYRQVTGPDTGKKDPDMSEANENVTGTRRLHNGLFPSGFGRFTAVEYLPRGEDTADDYPFTLMAGSTLYQFGDGSCSSRSARLKQFSPGAFLEIGAADANELGVINGDRVKVTSAQGTVSASVKVSQTLPPRLLYMPVSFPACPVYELFPWVHPQDKTPALKTCAVKLERTTADGQTKANSGR
jgi:predicted molibdopterin-dependent oxidoreductase YjgC